MVAAGVVVDEVDDPRESALPDAFLLRFLGRFSPDFEREVLLDFLAPVVGVDEVAALLMEEELIDTAMCMP